MEHSNIDTFATVSGQDLWDAADLLEERARQGASVAQLTDMEKNMGIRHTPGGFLLSPSCRRWGVHGALSVYDILHCFYNNGIVGFEVKLLTEKLNGLGLSRAELRERLGNVELESYRREGLGSLLRTLTDAFFASTWKADGSSQEALLPLLHLFLVLQDPGTVAEAAAEVACFLLLCQRCYVLSQVQSRHEQCLLPLLQEAQARHHHAFLECYGSHKPKHHYALHQTRIWFASYKVIVSSQDKYISTFTSLRHESQDSLLHTASPVTRRRQSENIRS